MWRSVFRGVMEGVGCFVAWGALFVVPQVLMWFGHFWWAAFAAIASLLILEYEYQGAMGFVFLRGLLSFYLLASSGTAFAGSVALLLRKHGLGWGYALPCTIVAVLVAGYTLVKVDPWLGRLYSILHRSSRESRPQ